MNQIGAMAAWVAAVNRFYTSLGESLICGFIGAFVGRLLEKEELGF